MTTQDNQEREIILKVMILIYQRNFLVLKEIRTLPYWLKLLTNAEYKKSHVLILQLVLQSLGVSNEEIC